MNAPSNGCRRWRSQLVEAAFGELAGQRQRAFEAHLATCDRCRAQMTSFKETTAVISQAMPQRSPARQLDAWQRLTPELDTIDRSRQSSPHGLRLGYPAAAALAVALLLLGLGLGLFVRAPIETPTPAKIASQTVDAELSFALFLERSTPLLLAVANRQIGGLETASFGEAERRVAERLANEAAGLAEELAKQGLRRQANLLRDLEVVFLQLANLPEQQYRHGLAMVQDTLESRALLFQLSVEAMRL